MVCFHEHFQSYLEEQSDLSQGAIDMIGIVRNEEALLSTAFTEILSHASNIHDDAK